MNKREWRELVRHIYHSEIQPLLGNLRDRGPFFEHHYLHNEAIRRLIRAIRVCRLIQTSLDEGLPDAVTPEFVNDVFADIERGVDLADETLVQTGIIEVIERYADEIAEGMDIDDMPDEDIEAVRLSGSFDPQRECQLLMRRTKREIRVRVSRSERGGFAIELRHAKRGDRAKEGRSAAATPA